MNELTTPGPRGDPAQFNSSLFFDFVRWIDRGEKTTRTYLNNLRQFAAWLKYSEISAPNRENILQYREWLATEHEAIQLDPESAAGWTLRKKQRITCRPNTVKQYLQSVRQFFTWTAANGFYPNIAANIHAPKIRTTAHRKEAFTAKEVLTIEQSILERGKERERAAELAEKDTAGRVQRSAEQNKRLFALYLLAVNAGLRTIELSRANIEDLEIKSGQAWLYIWGKGHTEPDERKPLAPEVAQALEDYLQIRADGPTGCSPLFCSTGNRSGGKRIAPTTISRILKNAIKEAGYNSPRLTAHSLRHTAGTAAIKLTKDIYLTQRYMRHSDPKTTQIYLHVDLTEQEAAIAQQIYNHYHGKDCGAQDQL